MARCRSTAPKPDKFNVDHPLNKLEERMIATMVERNYTALDYLEWVCPQRELEALMQAYPFAAQNGGRFDVRLPMNNGTTCQIQLSTTDINVLTPHDRSYKPELFGSKKLELQECQFGERIRASLEAAHAIQHQFDVIRRVVKWMNDNTITPGWARHYLPGLGVLLPADHAFHQVKGDVFTERAMPHTIATDIRNIPAILTNAIMVPEPPAQPKTIGHIQIGDGQRYAWFTK